MTRNGFHVRLALIAAILSIGIGLGHAQAIAAVQTKTVRRAPQIKLRRITPAQRKAAAARAAELRAKVAAQSNGAVAATVPAMDPGGIPDYFGTTPNWANSPLPISAAGVNIVSVDGNGSGAKATATVVNGVVTNITLVNGGTGYTSAPNVQITGNGTGASATATIDLTSGAVTGIILNTGGSGYLASGIRKFMDSLPGLNTSNNLGQMIPIAVPDTITYPGCDYYEIELQEYAEQMHSDLLPTTLRGYVQTNSGTDTGGQNTIAPAPIHYLGPAIIAQKDRPVRIKFTNKLPTGQGGNLFLPVDKTIMGAGMGPLGMMVPAGMQMDYTENRAAIHLHGGNTPWISDGTMHQWITPAGDNTPYPKGVSVQNVPDMPDPGPGAVTLFYTNQQSARLLFYHDHAYGITRLNVYGGEAAGYLVQDPVEKGLVDSGVIPADQIPLVIQDRTFLPSETQLAAEDPTWPLPLDPTRSNLWFPHIYMPNQNPYDVMGANAMGRWDYGPWFWPPFTGITHGEVENPRYDPINAPWEPPFIPGTPNPSIVPEAFMDTPIVNGTAYPYLNVEPKAYRFRILNAANDRYWNLGIYQADPAVVTPDGRTMTEVKMVAFDTSYVPGFPLVWGTKDARDGGVPDPATAGPPMIQIGTEGGFLPAPYVVPIRPINYNYNRRDVTVLNVLEKALFLGPAERADVIVDFSQYAGQTLILYNDSPAPVPAVDPRVDYYTGDPDQTDTGGAPSTLPGYGPNTRTIMQIRVANTAPALAYDLAGLQTALPAAYGQAQKKPLVPQAGYNAPFGATYPADAYGRIQDTQMNVFNGGGLGSIKLLTGGKGYTSVPDVALTGGNGMGATAVATLAPTTVASLALTAGGSGYTSAPSVAISGGGGSGATATASLSTRSVATVTVTNGGNGYISVPNASFTGGGGSGATAVATVVNRKVTAITVTNGGGGYTSAPTVSITGGGGTGARGAAVLAPTSVAGLTVTNPGTGYTSVPTVTITGGGGGATATALLTATKVGSVTLTNPGTGYTIAPSVVFTGGGGTGAYAQAVGPVMNLAPKSIIENFDTGYGRMNALLGVEVPNTSANVQTSIPYMDIDPPTELFKNSDTNALIGTAPDGTQIWKITHNGVDTHAIHWHMFDVQLVNRVGWDGMIKPPDANEMGWKDTIRMNPLEDVVVALRPVVPDTPFDLPNSVRALDVTMRIGSTTGFFNVDPTNQPAPVTNQLVNFGYEFMWHCHLLGHEENTMMRMICVARPPKDPSNLAGTVSGTNNNQTITLTWTDNSANETGFVVQRASSVSGPWTTLRTLPAAAGVGTTVTFANTGLKKATTFYYRVYATNVVGYTQKYAAPAVGYPTLTEDSAPITLTIATL